MTFDEFLYMPCADDTAKQYRLCSLIEHSATRQGGHYVAFVRNRGAWYEANDASVTAVGLPRALESQMYCAAYELMDSAPGTSAHGSGAQPQPMADDTPQQPCSHSRTRRTRPLRPPPGPTADNLQSYRRRLNGQQWMTTEDLACGRQDARQADGLSSTQHLPAGLTFPLTADEVTAGFRDMRRDNKAAQILRATLKGQLSPAIMFGDGSHWRCICISHAQNIVYLLDPMGPGFFTPAVRRSIEDRLHTDAPAHQIRESQHILQPPQQDAYNCGPLAIYICHEWEKCIEDGQLTVTPPETWLVDLASRAQQSKQPHHQFMGDSIRKELADRRDIMSGARNSARASAMHLDPPMPSLVPPRAGTRLQHAPTAQPDEAAPGAPGAPGERPDDKAHTQRIPVTAATKLERCIQDLMQRYQITSNTAKYQLLHTYSPCSEGCAHALDLVEAGWSLEQELEEAPIQLREQEVMAALLPAVEKAFSSTVPADETVDTKPHPDPNLDFHTWNIRGL